MSRPGPWASLHPARDAQRHAQRIRRTQRTGSGPAARSAEAPPGFPWRLDVNSHGDLVAIHASGAVRVIARAEED